jgi:hypothetical protein
MNYKVKIPLLLLLAQLWISTSSAQTFRSGLRLGLNASQINGDEMAGFDKAGPVGGLYVSTPFSNKWSGQFEMLYSQKGSKRKFTDAGAGPGLWNVLRLHYLELPVMMNYNLNKKISFHGGLGAAYLFGSYWEDDRGGERDADFVKKYEINSLIGGQYLLGKKVSLYVRYTNSLLPIAKGEIPMVVQSRLRGMFSAVASFGFYYHFVPMKN